MRDSRAETLMSMSVRNDAGSSGFLVVGRHVVPVRRVPDQGIDVEHVCRQGPLNQVATAGSAQCQRAFEPALVELQLDIGEREVMRPRNEIAADLRAMRA